MVAAPSTQLQDPYTLVHAHYWPNLDPGVVHSAGQVYNLWGTALNDAATTSNTSYRPQFADLLQGASGNGLLATHDANVALWLSDATTYTGLGAAAIKAATDLSDLRTTLAGIINEWQPWYEWGELLRILGRIMVDSKLPKVVSEGEKLISEGTQLMQDASSGANSAAAAATAATVASIIATLSAASKTLPATYLTSLNNGGGNNGGYTLTDVSWNTPGSSGTPVSDSVGSQPVATGTPSMGTSSTGSPTSGGQSTSGGAGPGSSSSGTSGSTSGTSGANPGSAPGSSGGGNASGAPTTGSDGSGAASGGAGQPGSGAGAAPPAQSGGGSAPSGDGSGGGPVVSSAPGNSGGSSSVSSVPVNSSPPSSSTSPPPASSSSPKSGSGSGQGSGQGSASTSGADGSGLAAGMGIPGAVPLLGGHGHGMAGALAPMHGLADGGSLHSMDGFGGSDGGAGGGGMMPMSPSPPLAPYSPPGAGLAAPTPPAPTPAMPLAVAPAGAAAGGAGALIASGVAATKGASSSTKRVNPDIESAQRVLAGLVKACPARPIFWAVSVLRTSVGPQTLIAGSVGGGAYLPPEVSVPSTVRLAVLDPALPSGWAEEWMGWQSPLAILIDHYERLAKVVSGVKVSVMTTSELWPSTPECGGDFVAVRHEELVMSAAPPLVGGHRLTATDPELAARLTALDRGGDVTNFVAAQLTRAIWIAGSQPDGTGMPIAVKEDADLLGLVAQGAARREHWGDYRRDVERRADGAVMMPEMHAPRDADDSPGSATARMWYLHYYARGRIAEMVNCWASQPVSLLDIAYCGVAAGFGAVLLAVVTELEKQLGQSPGPAGDRQ